MSGAAARRWAPYAAVFILSCAFAAFLQFQHPWLPERDGYLHVAIASQVRAHGPLRAFPWATLGLWSDGYADTAPLYHLLLAPLTLLPDQAVAGKAAAVLLAGAVFTSFFAVLRLQRVAKAGLWTLLLACSGPYFLWRVGVTRPQALSVLLLLWTVYALLDGRTRLLALVCLLYPVSYAAAFLPLVFVAVRALHGLAADGTTDLRTPLVAAAACAVGMVIHPNFPANLQMLWVQNVYVLFLSATANVAYHMGQELRPMDTLNLVGSHAPLFAAWLAVSWLALESGLRSGPKARLAVSFALTAMAMAFVSARFIEYAIPLGLLALALRCDELVGAGALEAHFRRFPSRRAWTHPALAAFFLVGGAASTWGALRVYRQTRPSPFVGAMAWVAANVPAGETVFSCSWGDPPALMSHDASHRYLFFMDPAFVVWRSPALWRAWDDAARGRLGPATYGVLRDALGTRVGVCEAGALGLRAAVEADSRMKVVYDDGKAFVFRL